MRLRTVLSLLTHRVTWRFLLVLAGSLGAASLSQDLVQLETLVCSVVPCLD
ncbi:hypothetical protein pEp_SNUABM10_00004 [Erwinia phage pEp_SNUABM_10]|nr:hypothetical protein pEp_SNUABM03_00001 [Erwinia phage pEp_SNUABM_03]QOC57658.1 hypothetical protein pEp_SNUABM04_00004 [Erwinia phage pEp_SNUABM_04]QOC57708.1 hypothetical protein pEp_SNUABM10_00004 [Erwinia phage pEp_SNUABM_10]QOC57761.1 hypothetical protein pEp_SNUABM11_00005 [Erwinia phage pEp_SNUABM_11]